MKRLYHIMSEILYVWHLCMVGHSRLIVQEDLYCLLQDHIPLYVCCVEMGQIPIPRQQELIPFILFIHMYTLITPISQSHLAHPTANHSHTALIVRVCEKSLIAKADRIGKHNGRRRRFERRNDHIL